MKVIEREITIPKKGYANESFIDFFSKKIGDYIECDDHVLRFIISKSDEKNFYCEIMLLKDAGDCCGSFLDIFYVNPRDYENTDKFNAVLLVPTGIGAEIGGHAGDAGPVARLLASACDTLITHPNVVNASDINELPENGLYVEGSVLTRLLTGMISLQKVRSNRIMLVMDKHKDLDIAALTINAVSAARATMGLDCPKIIQLSPSIKMSGGKYSGSGRAIGQVTKLERLYCLLEEHRADYDAVALATLVDVPERFHTEYYEKCGDIINPWGGVEAMLSHAVTTLFNVPTAHAPMFETEEIKNLNVGIVDPRMSAEAISACFIHCVLKGLHRSPRIVNKASNISIPGLISAADISCLIIPDGCVGIPTLAALEQGIPVIAVRDNKNIMQNDLQDLDFAPGKLHIVDNYLEVAGVMAAIKSGVHTSTICRPLNKTKVVNT